jgi:hypothetical protein
MKYHLKLHFLLKSIPAMHIKCTLFIKIGKEISDSLFTFKEYTITPDLILLTPQKKKTRISPPTEAGRIINV